MLSLRLVIVEIREPYHKTLLTWVRHCVKFSKKKNAMLPKTLDVIFFTISRFSGVKSHVRPTNRTLRVLFLSYSSLRTRSLKVLVTIFVLCSY